MSVVLRPAGPRDAEALTRLYVAARRAAAAAGTIPAMVHSPEETRRWIAEVVLPGRECWLAEADGHPVGLLVLDGAWLDQLYVDPDRTGTGIGARLLRLAQQRRPAGLTLWTFAANAGAQRFYRRHGFAEVERTDGAANEERAPDVRLVWRPA